MAPKVNQVFDEVLVLYAISGKREALNRLADRWRPRHYAHACRLLGSADRAGDAVQDAWINIIRGLGGLKDPAAFPAWSYAIVTRRCQDSLRKRLRNKEDPLEEDIAAVTVNEGQGATNLRSALAGLSPDHRAAIALFYKDGLTIPEIAKALTIPIGTVKTRLFHARRLLRQHFEGD